MAFLRFLLRRAGQRWQILLTLGLGVVLATALLSSGPQLVDTVTEMGLQLTLSASPVADANLRLTTSAQLDSQHFQALDGEVKATLEAEIGPYLDRVVWMAESPWMMPWVDGVLTSDTRVNLRSVAGIEDSVEYIAGEWPEGPGDGADGQSPNATRPAAVKAIVSDAMARALVLRVGDGLPLSREQHSSEADAWIDVTGIVGPKNPLDPYWYGEFSPLVPRDSPRWSAEYGVIVPLDAFFTAVPTLFPGEPIDLAWHVLLSHDVFSSQDIGPLQARLAALETKLLAMQPPVTLQTGVPLILDRFQQQLESIRVPLYILLAEVVLLALYFVTMVAALAMGQAEQEFATLRSRGTSTWQIARIPLVEALLVVAVALASGPWLGAALVRGLSWVGPLADLEQATATGMASSGLSVGQSAWLAAGVAALACLVGLVVPLRPALRRSIVTHLQTMARGDRPPWWQRAYLDVFLLLGGLVLLWRLRLYGEMTVSGPGGARLDWLLLLAPVAWLLGSATILLRVFPLLLRGLAHLAARRPGLEGALALWQASRNPTHVTRLVLLLTLAVALGNLSTGLSITLDQSEVDRATYLAGNDLRLVSQRAVPLDALQSAPGVLQLAAIWRGRGTVDLGSTEANPGFELLAIEPESFASVTTLRPDYAERADLRSASIEELLGQLAIPEGQHPSLLPLPGQPAAVGLWLWGMPEDKAEFDSAARWVDDDDNAERVGLVAKLQTAQGELFTVELHRQDAPGRSPLQTDSFTLQATVGERDVSLNVRIKPDNKGWHLFQGVLPVLPSSGYPLNLHSLWFENRATRLGEPIIMGMGLVADDLIVVDAVTGERRMVVDFEGADVPLFLNAQYGANRWLGLYTELTSDVAHSGRRAQMVGLAFLYPGHTYPLRLRQTWTTDPLPALASPAFMRATGLHVSDLVRAWVGGQQQSARQPEVDLEAIGLGDLDMGQPESDLDAIDFRVVGTVQHFPTMYEEGSEAGYLITSRDLLLPLLNDALPEATNPNEALVQTDGSSSTDELSALVPLLSQVWQADSIRKSLKANPLALGLRGVTFFGFALTMLLSLVGFAAHSYLSIRQQQTLYGVMRAMGMSPRQLYGWIVVEQAILILAGLLLGTILGLLLNQITLPRLPVSLGEQQPVPPFVPHADWVRVGMLYLALVVALLAIVGIVTALLWRARIHRVLRIGQE